MNNFRNIFIVILLSGVLAVGAKAQTVNTGEGAVKSKEGLYLVEDAKVKIAFVRPDFNLANYGSIFIEPLAFALEQSNAQAEIKRRKNCWVSVSRLSACTRNNPFVITEADRNQIASIFAEIMASHMRKGPEIPMVNAAGPRVLVYRPTISEIILTAPNQGEYYASTRSSRSRVYTKSSGSITMVGQFFDGETGDLVAYVIDQQIGTDFWHDNNRISNWGDIRLAFHYWAKLFRTRLDQDFSIKIKE